ncbi:putative Zinc finger, RanBP2-type [Helianthus annuus]|nr:putative Zinc finger, RanBP2-type [Helianthus annuus]KAJ0685492.1 putative Zinc finger, RanBP2-type [Helianthus annuus]KAJ0689391.1 putative Zinc finger, RanBP2-type [Helianthus annuus]KAJ0870716.1 putative Zinc finger, RanBP2-type [Helianthus annuus]
MALSHILRSHRFFPRNLYLHKPIFTNQLIINPFSSTAPNSPETNPKPTSLSARMSFVFDQIDAIEKERTQKDETLQRIRAWRDSKKEKQPTLEQGGEKQLKEDDVEVEVEVAVKEKGLLGKEVELVHPWPEWIELMERLVQQNYFDCRRRDEGKLIADSGFAEAMEEEGFDFTRDWKTVQTAGISFGKDRFDILRSLSRQDIQLLIGYGCPSPDKKVVFSSKLLRKHVRLDEGDVCSSCSLRNSCERAYLITNKEDEARTIDIMRVLMAYGFDPVNGSVVNDSLLKKKAVKGAVRKLLHEVVKLSGIPIDPNLAPPIIKRPPPKVKQTPPPPKRRVGRDDVEMKKGDWLCPKCDFMNFAKNTVCLQCDAKRPKRQLLPGEWECPECQFLNYRRNMACFHCECKRPPDEFTENQMQDKQHGQRSRLDHGPSRKEVSDAWNFDFDENESDGAEVAAFEYADSRKLDQDYANRPPDNNSFNRRPVRPQESEYPSFVAKPGAGFDDFDDEEDDDVNSYELDTKPSSSSVNFSDIDVDSESEDENYNTRKQVPSQKNKRVSKSPKKSAVSEDDGVDFNSDDDLPVHPNWKSSHVADFRHKSRGRMSAKFGSDEDSDLYSGDEDLSDDDFRHKRKGRVNTRSNDYHKVKHDFSDEDDHFSRGKPRGGKKTSDRKHPAKSFRNESYESGFNGSRNHRQERFSDRQPRKSSRGRDSSGSGSGAGAGAATDSYLDHERFSRPRVNVR